MGYKLDKQRIKRLDRLMFDYGLWLRGGRSSLGIFPEAWPETTKKEPYKPPRVRRKAGKPKPLVTPHQPHSTRKQASSKPLHGNLYPVFNRIHSVVIIQPEITKLVVYCIWMKGMCYQDSSALLNMSSKQVGIYRKSVLELIENSHVFC